MVPTKILTVTLVVHRDLIHKKSEALSMYNFLETFLFKVRYKNL